jgi:hypothetical protein
MAVWYWVLWRFSSDPSVGSKLTYHAYEYQFQVLGLNLVESLCQSFVYWVVLALIPEAEIF